MAEDGIRSWLVDRLFAYLDPLKTHFSDDCSWIYLAGGAALYEKETIPIEAWARPLWGLAPFWHGGGRNKDGFFERAYVCGLAAGADPSSPSFWGGGRDHDQRFVEMAAIAYGLLLAPDVLWEPLSAEERKNVVSWLDLANHASFPQGNWLWFRALVNLALRERGIGWNQRLLEEDLDTLDSFYRGHGWYKDGPEGVFDYYNAMVFHFMSLLYAGLFDAEDPIRAKCYIERAQEFAQEYILLFSKRGEAVPFGRSMTYRFAQSGFWSVALATRTDLGSMFTPGCLLGLVKRSIACWNPGDICDNGGTQSIGYGSPVSTWQKATTHLALPIGASWRLPAWHFLPRTLHRKRKRSLCRSCPGLPRPSSASLQGMQKARQRSIVQGLCQRFRLCSLLPSMRSSPTARASASRCRARRKQSRKRHLTACLPSRL
ncbi:MAG: DUF2264 domain-containing protein [Coriobacteriaceae bacterium]|nr:MAG: DUF2264 domain-containing protein [Coriobacteriaceae bacterium]